MSNFILGKDLKIHWDIEDFELFALLKKGLQPYTRHGHKIIDTDTLEHAREHSIEWYAGLIRGEQETGKVITGKGFSSAHRLTEQEILERAKKAFESEPLKPLNPPPNCMSFTLPLDEKKASKVLFDLNSLLFKRDQVSEIAEQHGYPRLEAPHTESQSYEDIIKGLTLQSVDYESIIIKPESGNKETYRYDDRDLKFKNNRTREWKFFLRVLKSKQPIKVNEHERKWMRQVEEKLKNFIGNLNNIEIPKDYKIFYHDPTDERGCYRTRFKTLRSKQDISFINKEDFVKKFTELLDLIRNGKADESTEADFLKCLEIGREKKYLTSEVYQGALAVFKTASTRHEEIEYIPRITTLVNDPDLS